MYFDKTYLRKTLGMIKYGTPFTAVATYFTYVIPYPPFFTSYPDSVELFLTDLFITKGVILTTLPPLSSAILAPSGVTYCTRPSM